MSEVEGKAEEAEDMEIVFVPDGQTLEEPVAEVVKPTGKTLTDEEYAALLARGETANALVAPLGGLVDKMNQPSPAPVNVQQPGETKAEFYARMEAQAFLPGKFGEAVEEMTDRKMAPIIGQMTNLLIGQEKRLMAVDPERGVNFRRYEKDIEAEIQAIPMQYRHPGMYEEAYQKVILKKQPELFQEQLTASRAELEKQILEKYGIDPNKVQAAGVGAAQSKVAVQSLGQKVGGGAVDTAIKQSLKLYQSEADRMVNLGMNPKDTEQVKSFLKTHPRRVK